MDEVEGQMLQMLYICKEKKSMWSEMERQR